jgi:hypothetical protein
MKPAAYDNIGIGTIILPLPASAISKIEIGGRFCETPWRLTQTPYKKQTSVARAATPFLKPL